MSLTKNQKINLIGLFGAAILSAALLIVIREYYSPDLKYEKGSFYILGESWITFLKLTNYGRSDAEDIRVNIKFNKLIKEINLNDKLVSLENIDGGNGTESYTGEINRLVPSQEALIYFSIDLKSDIPHESPQIFLLNIVYKGGFAKIGVSFSELFIVYSCLIFSTIMLIIALILIWRDTIKVKGIFIINLINYLIIMMLATKKISWVKLKN
jgi:hypothetical protein